MTAGLQSRARCTRSNATGAWWRVRSGYVAAGPPRFTLSVPTLHQHQLKELATRGAYAVLLTNASRATKLWPAHAWHVVEAELARRGLHTILIWGSEAEACRDAGEKHRAWSLHTSRMGDAGPACRVAGTCKSCGRHRYGADAPRRCGGVPTIGIFCDYDPNLVGIRGEAPCESLGGISGGPAANEVLAALERTLASRTPGR